MKLEMPKEKRGKNAKYLATIKRRQGRDALPRKFLTDDAIGSYTARPKEQYLKVNDSISVTDVVKGDRFAFYLKWNSRNGRCV